MKKIICFDVDNVICKTQKKKYATAKPNEKAIKKINHLYKRGYIIKVFTGRYMGRNKENVKKAHKEGYKFTFEQLNKWEVKFHKLIMGKPSYDIIVDDPDPLTRKSNSPRVAFITGGVSVL